MSAHPAPRILEVTRTPLFKHCLPAQTRWLPPGPALVTGDDLCTPEPRDPLSLWRLWRELRRGGFDLAIFPAVELDYPHDGSAGKRLLRRIIGWAASGGTFTRILAWLLKWVRGWSGTAVVFVDWADTPRLSYEVCRLLPDFLCYFKRELIEEKTLHHRLLADSFVHTRVLSIPLFLPRENVPLSAEPEKTADVFFAGNTGGSVRGSGLEELLAMRKRGVVVDVPGERLGYEEYLQRMARAWLVWSPEGIGWDCYRHYEACFAGSVPVINEPTLPRRRYLEDQVHCFYYPLRPGELTRTVEAALTDQPRLRRMASAGRAFTLAHHTRAGLVTMMQREIVVQLAARNDLSRLREAWSI